MILHLLRTVLSTTCVTLNHRRSPVFDNQHAVLVHCLHALVGVDSFRKPFQPSNDGPYRVFLWVYNSFILDPDGHHDSVSINCIKVAFIKNSYLPKTTVSPLTPIDLCLILSWVPHHMQSCFLNCQKHVLLYHHGHRQPRLFKHPHLKLVLAAQCTCRTEYTCNFGK